MIDSGNDERAASASIQLHPLSSAGGVGSGRRRWKLRGRRANSAHGKSQDDSAVAESLAHELLPLVGGHSSNAAVSATTAVCARSASTRPGPTRGGLPFFEISKGTEISSTYGRRPQLIKLVVGNGSGEVWGDSGIRYPLLISPAYSVCLPSCPYCRPCLVPSGRSDKSYECPRRAPVSCGLERPALISQSRSIPNLPDGLQLVRAQFKYTA